MYFFRFNLLLYLFYILLKWSVNGYPMENYEQHNAFANARGADPSDYPDLTCGLSDAEVESTLNGLSLKDLDALSKLLDDSINEDEDAGAKAKNRHRPVKAQQNDYLDAADDDVGRATDQIKSSNDDSCTDDNDPCKDKHKERPSNCKNKETDFCTQRPKCSKKPKCSTTERNTAKCTPTKESATKCPKTNLPKQRLGGFLDDDTEPSKCGEKPKKKPKKPPPSCEEECDPDDDMCLQRNKSMYKNKQNEDEDSDKKSDNSSGGSCVSTLEDMQELVQDIAKTNVPKLSSIQWDNNNDLTPYSFPMDTNVETADVDAKLNELDRVTNNHKLTTFGKHVGNTARGELVVPMGYETEKLTEAAGKEHNNQIKRHYHIVNPAENFYHDARQHGFGELAACAAAPEPQKQNYVNVDNGAEDERQLEAAQAADGDSFIASNERAPPRYLIRTQDGYISSGNEPGLQHLEGDQRSSEKFDFEKYQRMETPVEEQQFYDFLRHKRENRKTDDAPVSGKESYIKKLMDSFPHDQDNQNNDDFVLREEEHDHVRIKRS